MKSELKYHIVWCTKYRRKVLEEDIQEYLKKSIADICDKNGYTIMSLEITECYVHIFVKASTKDSVHRIVSQIKSHTASELRDEFPQLKSRLPCMWSRNYYADTLGEVSEEKVRSYIKAQKNV